MGFKVHRFMCGEEECSFFDDLLFDSNDPADAARLEGVEECPECGAISFKRVMFMNSNGFNTSKTSKSIPDGSGRFNERREERKLERALAQAKRMGDTDTIKDVAKESIERGKLIKGL